MLQGLQCKTFHNKIFTRVLWLILFLLVLLYFLMIQKILEKWKTSTGRWPRQSSVQVSVIQPNSECDIGSWRNPLTSYLSMANTKGSSQSWAVFPLIKHLVVDLCAAHSYPTSVWNFELTSILVVWLQASSSHRCSPGRLLRLVVEPFFC